MIHPWWGEIVFGFLFGVGFGTGTWLMRQILK